MVNIAFPYGKTKLTASFEEASLAGVLMSEIGNYVPKADPQTLVAKALEAPIGSRSLAELAAGKKNSRQQYK